jgi:pSer/pThr/pTyr-binding forkhead associated (FHA) protein
MQSLSARRTHLGPLAREACSPAGNLASWWAGRADPDRQEWPLAGRRLRVQSPLTLGREDVDVLMDAPMVSRRHAVVRPVDGGLEIDDLGSTNGTWVNGERIEGATRLAEGDVIGVGSVLAVVESDEAPIPRAASVVRDATAVSGALPEWQTFAGKGVTVHAPQGSYPAGRAAAELRDAEKAIAALEALLSPPPDRLGQPVEVYLTDAVVEEVSPITRASDEEGLLRVVQPENPGAPIVYDLARLLVGRWFGPEAARAALFVDGIAGIAGSRLGSTPSIEEADEAVRGELAGGGEVSVFSPDPGPVVPISFVGFLLKTHGPEALRRFLETYDPDRRDQAATEVYQRPLGSLEELWLSSLRELTGFRATLGVLLGHLRL